MHVYLCRALNFKIMRDVDRMTNLVDSPPTFVFLDTPPSPIFFTDSPSVLIFCTASHPFFPPQYLRWNTIYGMIKGTSGD